MLETILRVDQVASRAAPAFVVQRVLIILISSNNCRLIMSPIMNNGFALFTGRGVVDVDGKIANRN